MNYDLPWSKAWLAWAVLLVPLLAASDGADSTSPSSPGAPRQTSSNRLDLVNQARNGAHVSATDGSGRLGLVISPDSQGAIVERVVIGGPAWQTGIRIGDVIVAADTKPLAGLAMPRIARLLRGPVDTKIELILKRRGQKELLQVTPTRAMVRPPPDVPALRVN